MDFTIAINRTLGTEGGYVDDPKDPGGETKFGISKRSYPNVDIKNLTREQAVAIYKVDFWDRVHAAAMPTLLQFQALDFAVNSGIETVVRKLQHALGVADDGHWGPVTQAAAAAANPAALTFLFLAERQEYMTSCSNWASAGKGWARRIATDMRFAALDLQGGTA